MSVVGCAGRVVGCRGRPVAESQEAVDSRPTVGDPLSGVGECPSHAVDYGLVWRDVVFVSGRPGRVGLLTLDRGLVSVACGAVAVVCGLSAVLRGVAAVVGGGAAITAGGEPADADVKEVGVEVVDPGDGGRP